MINILPSLFLELAINFSTNNYMSHLNTVPYLHTSKHTGKHTHSSYTILPHPWQLPPIDCSDSEKMMELYNTLSKSTHHQTTVRHINAPSLMLIILKFQFSFLMKVFLNPVIYLLWSMPIYGRHSLLILV